MWARCFFPLVVSLQLNVNNHSLTNHQVTPRSLYTSRPAGMRLNIVVETVKLIGVQHPKYLRINAWGDKGSGLRHRVLIACLHHFDFAQARWY